MQHPQAKVQPARPDLIVAKPRGGRLDPSGETVTMGTYWTRRLQAGDVKRVAEPAKSKKSTAKS